MNHESPVNDLKIPRPVVRVRNYKASRWMDRDRRWLTASLPTAPCPGMFIICHFERIEKSIYIF